MKGFRKCYICNAMDGTDGDMLWNGCEEDGHVRSEREEQESTDFECGGRNTDW